MVIWLFYCHTVVYSIFFLICLGSLPYFATICHSLLLSWIKTEQHFHVCVICTNVQSHSRGKDTLVISLLVPVYVTQKLPHLVGPLCYKHRPGYERMTHRPALLNEPCQRDDKDREENLLLNRTSGNESQSESI